MALKSSSVKKSIASRLADAALAAGNGVVSFVSGVLAMALVLYSGYVLYDTFHTEYEAYSSVWDLMKYKPVTLSDGDSPLGGLSDTVKDYCAWLTVDDSPIDYPVVQGQDDLYYAWHNIYGESSLTGAIYLSAANSRDFSDDYSLVFGHHMDNGAMFGSLGRFRDESYFNAHRTGVLVTLSGIYDLRIYAVVSTDAYENRIYTVGSKENVMAFLASGGEGGTGVGTKVLIYDEEIASKAQKILAMSTCANADTAGRLVVFAELVKRSGPDLQVEPLDVVYDGQPHALTATSATEDAVIEYSLDGGKTWTDEIPVLTDVGAQDVVVRAVSILNGVNISRTTMIVRPRPVVVTVQNVSKAAGMKDPEFTASVSGLLDGDSVEYTIARTDENEKPGTYHGVIKASGETLQGNYTVTYVPGDLTILSGMKVIRIQKKWPGASPEDLPPELDVVLNAGGYTQVVTLNPANDWYAEVWLPEDQAYFWQEPDTPGFTRVVMKTDENDLTTSISRKDPVVPETGARHRVTIRYINLNGETVAESGVMELTEGSRYEVASPVVDGYTPSLGIVSGVTGSGDLVITVLYAPDELGTVSPYLTPTGVGKIYYHEGECYE